MSSCVNIILELYILHCLNLVTNKATKCGTVESNQNIVKQNRYYLIVTTKCIGRGEMLNSSPQIDFELKSLYFVTISLQIGTGLQALHVTDPRSNCSTRLSGHES